MGDAAGATCSPPTTRRCAGGRALRRARGQDDRRRLPRGFDGPPSRAALRARDRRRGARAGHQRARRLHTGECELIGDDVGGMAVHIAARVARWPPRGDPGLRHGLRHGRRIGPGVRRSAARTSCGACPGRWPVFACTLSGTRADTVCGVHRKLRNPRRCGSREVRRKLTDDGERTPTERNSMFRMSCASAQGLWLLASAIVLGAARPPSPSPAARRQAAARRQPQPERQPEPVVHARRPRSSPTTRPTAPASPTSPTTAAARSTAAGPAPAAPRRATSPASAPTTSPTGARSSRLERQERDRGRPHQGREPTPRRSRRTRRAWRPA